jgi:uncharacterized protein YgiM (DUF1202 family)
VRQGPSADTEKLTTITKGTRIEVLDKTPTNGWVKIRVDGIEGYVSGSYINF